MADKQTPSRKGASSAKGATGARAAGSTTGASKAPAGGKGARPTSKKGLAARIAGILAIGALVLALVGMLAGLVFYNRTELPDPNRDFTTNTTFLYYNDSKTKLGSFAVQNRQSIPYAQMPQNIKDAVIAAENRSFWTDRGISPTGIVRSAWTIARGGEMQGGSTITQQYIKILYLSSDRTMTRKLRELALAVKLGKEVSKEQILEGYLNTIYFGRGAYGIQAASRSYFNTDAKNLTVPQSAVLASVLNNPSAFDPSVAKGNSQRLLERYRYVLSGMLEAGQITQAQHDQWAKALPAFPEIPLNQRWGGTNGYLLKAVQNELLAKGFTQAQIDGGGLSITTTFDKKLQDHAIEVGQKYKEEVGSNGPGGAKAIHPALASVDVATGGVLAMYGGDDYIKNTRNWATTARPAASTFKTYATVAGLRGGMSLRTQLKGNTFTPPGDSVPIRNEFSMQYGPVTLRKALADSINTAFVDMTDKLENGPAAVVKAATDAGVRKGAGWDLNGRIALGIAEVSPLDNAAGYATIANSGLRMDRHVVAQVKDAKGKVIYTAPTKGTQAIEEDVARDVISGLRSVVQSGTGSVVSSRNYQVAGKTGTNGIDRDGKNVITSAWFVGFTPQIATSAMFVAGDDGNGSLDAYRRPGDSAFFGGTYPARMWRDYMRVAMEGRDWQSFPEAGNVNLGQERVGQVHVPPATRTAQPTERGTQQQSQPSQSATEAASSAPAATSQAPATSQPAATSQAPATTQPAATTRAPATTQPATQAAAPRTTQAAPRTTQPVTQPTQRTTQQGNGTAGNGGGNGAGNGAGNQGAGNQPAGAGASGNG
ncbi:transglycosylase domain-containing protein [Luteococcus peritonei]|uniref:Transglycosylase domain-containing protein n=1 Tax=Luteococcus peritonei TaxID=88874 RepID=A0ABW4RYV0_9ACTN